MRKRLGQAALGGLLGALLAAAPAAATSSVSLSASSATTHPGATVLLKGTSSGAAPGTVVGLYASRYPYRRTQRLASATTDSAGAYSFLVSPEENTRYTAVLGAAGPQATVTVGVRGRTSTTLEALTLGRARVSVVVYHPADLRWGGVLVRWSMASGAGRFHAAPATRSVRLSATATRLRTTVALPAGPYRFRVCFDPPNALALLNPRRPPGCVGRGYHGGASLPVGFPGPAAVARAAAFLAGRTGRKAFAVIDTEGRLSGTQVHRTFPCASVVKAMLLVAYLRRLDRLGQRRVDPHSASFLYPMIHVSDNNAATQTQSYVGDSGLYAVARLAGMTDFSVSGFWLTARISPADQARFFFEMDSLIPREFVGYARFLLSTIEPSQTWGVPPVARPLGYQTFFKDGSEPTALGQLVHQVDRLEGHGRRFAMAVMTDGDPSMAYGIATIRGVASGLLR